MKKNESIPNRRIRWRLPTQLLNYSNRPACGLSTAEQTGNPVLTPYGRMY